MLCGSFDCPDCDIILAAWFCCTRERVCRCQSQTTADSGDLRHHPLAIAFCKLKSNFQTVFLSNRQAIKYWNSICGASAELQNCSAAPSAYFFSLCCRYVCGFYLSKNFYKNWTCFRFRIIFILLNCSAPWQLWKNMLVPLHLKTFKITNEKLAIIVKNNLYKHYFSNFIVIFHHLI